MTEKMLMRREGAVGHMIFNQPEKRNAVSLSMWERATEILDAFESDPEIRVVVLSGAGGKAFVSGADISEFEDKRGTAEAQQHYNAQTGKVYDRIAAFPKPTIAMIDGFCIGGGLNLALPLRHPDLFGEVAVRHARGAAGAGLSVPGDPAAGEHRRHRQRPRPDVHGAPDRRPPMRCGSGWRSRSFPRTNWSRLSPTMPAVSRRTRH